MNTQLPRYPFEDFPFYYWDPIEELFGIPRSEPKNESTLADLLG